MKNIYFFFILCLLFGRITAQTLPPNSTINVVSVKKSGSTLYGLFELELDLRNLPFPNNPTALPEYYFFDPDIIDLQATFISPSGMEYVIDGFYYAAYNCITCDKLSASSLNTWKPDGVNTCSPCNTVNYSNSDPNFNQMIEDAPYTHFEKTDPNCSQQNPEYSWRIRFSPNEPGEWKYNIKLYVDKALGWQNNSNYNTGGLPTGKTMTSIYPNSVENPFLVFNCLPDPDPLYPSQEKGYVQTGSSGGRLSLSDGTSFYPMGPNLQSSFDIDPNSVRLIGNVSNDEGGICYYRKCIDLLSENKANYFRKIINSENYPYMNTTYINYSNPDYSANVGYELKEAWRIDDIIEYARRKKVYIKMAGLAAYRAANGAGGADWKSPLNPWYDGDPAHDYPYFFDPASAITRDNHKKFLRYAIARWGYATNIMAWELWDEFDHNNNLTNNSVFPHFYTWMYNTTQWIKEKDYNRHLISMAGTANTYFEQDNNLLFVSQIPFIDLTESNGARSNAVALNNRCDFIYPLSLWNSDQDIFEHPGNVFAQTLKPYFHNSYWSDLNEYNPCSLGLNEDLKDKLGLDLHNVFWHSLFSQSFGLISPFFPDKLFNSFTFENFGVCADYSKRWYTQGEVGQYKPIADYLSDNSEMLDEVLTNISSYDNTMRFLNRDPLNPQNLIPNQLFRAVGNKSASGLKTFGWIQLSAAEFLFARDNYCDYVTTLANKPATNLNPAYHFIELDVPVDGKYTIKWFNVASYNPGNGTTIPPSISHDLTPYFYPGNVIQDNSFPDNSPYEKTSVNGKLRFSIPNLDGAFGDMAFVVEFNEIQEDPGVFSCNTVISDLTRLIDLNNDGIEELVFNNRCEKNKYAFRAYSIGNNSGVSIPAIHMPLYDIEHRGTKYAQWMDFGDMWLTGNFSNSGTSATNEYLLVNRHVTSTGALSALTLMNPVNGNLFNNVPSDIGKRVFLDMNDRLFTGNTDQDVFDELVAINMDPNQSNAAIVVFDVATRKTKRLYNHYFGLAGWLDNDDKSILADGNGDGRKELVLINTDPSTGPGFLTTFDLTQTGHFPAGNPFIQYNMNQTLFDAFNDPCDRILVGDVFENPLYTQNGTKPDISDEIIFINTSQSSSEPAILIMDANTGIALSVISNSACNFCGWTDFNEDKILVMDVNGDGRSELVFYDENNSFNNGDGAIMTIDVNQPGSFNIMAMSLFNLTFSTQGFMNSEDNVLYGKNTFINPLRTSSQDYLVLVNRDQNPITAPFSDVSWVVDVSSTSFQTVGLRTPFLNPITNQENFKDLLNGSYTYFCDGSSAMMGTQSGSSGGGTLQKNNTLVEDVDNPSLYFYPNPASESLNFKNIVASTYEIYDVTGRLCKKGNVDSNSINISALHSGIYHMRIIDSNGGISTETFMKE